MVHTLLLIYINFLQVLVPKVVFRIVVFNCPFFDHPAVILPPVLCNGILWRYLAAVHMVWLVGQVPV